MGADDDLERRPRDVGFAVTDLSGSTARPWRTTDGGQRWSVAPLDG